MDLTRVSLAAAGSAALLVAAFGFQHLGGLAPCEMCLWQRWPHAAAILIGAAALATGHRALAALGAAALAVSVGLGLFHAGVEQGWWEGVTACAGGAGLSMDPDALFDQIMTAPMVRCDQIAWSFAGLSMAAWNALLSAGLLALWLAALARREQQ
ncbi:MAG: disulfide bond formation protein B [Pseudomonadota bacterium]